MNISNLYTELKRRNVFRVATAYAIAGWLIIQIFDTISPQLGFPEWIAPLVTILVLIGFPFAVIFAWAFELTPEGIQKSKEVDITESVTRNTGKKINKVIISVLSVAVFFLLTERIFFAESTILDRNVAKFDVASIAVLPFVNMSSDPENEFFSDGLSEELLNALAKIKDMKVAGRTSTFKFKGQNENLSFIANELKVEYILEGSVRKSGDRVRITAQLIKADDGYHLWSETYDRELTTTDVFDIQEEITRHVVEELKIKLLPEEQHEIVSRPTDNLEAYEVFLKATQTELTLVPKDLEKAIGYYNQAVELDPDFSEAYARMAIAQAFLYLNGNESLDYTLEKMKESIDQALLADLNSGIVYHALHFYHRLNGDGDKSDEALLKAVQLLPNNALVMVSYALLDNNRYRNPVNAERINNAYELDPDHPIVATQYARYLYWIDEFEESMNLLNQVIEKYPDYTEAHDAKIAQFVDAPYGEIAEAFKIAFAQYKKNPIDVNNISTMVEISTSLKMNGLARDVINNMKRDLPNNPGIFRNERFLYFATQDTAALTDLKFRMIEHFDVPENNLIFFDIVNLYLAEDFEKGIALMEKVWPGIKDESPDTNLPGIVYAQFLTKAGKNERASEITAYYCDFLRENIETLPDETYRVNDNWVRLTCQALLGEFEKALKTLKTAYFEQNSKANWYYYNLANPSRQLLFEQPMFNDLIADIEADIMGMRDSAVAYLKAEGEWREEWGE